MEIDVAFRGVFFKDKLARELVFEYFKQKSKVIGERSTVILNDTINVETQRLKSTISAETKWSKDKTFIKTFFGYGLKSGEAIPGITGKPSRKKPRPTDYAKYQEKINPIMKEVGEYAKKKIQTPNKPLNTL